ncbi:MAG: hypothetical protein PHU51_00680 [Candidatus Nanoarchaeia archaeon]|nr:hypothetical protein [Candidatus Nanoarchaeia archaeon]
MKLNEIIKNTRTKINEQTAKLPVVGKTLTQKMTPKTIAKTALATLIGVTMLKDNVHFGSVDLNNIHGENHYVFGVLPITEARGSGNIYSFGLIAPITELDDYVGNSVSIGLLGAVSSVDGKTNGNVSSMALLGTLSYFKENAKFNGDVNSWAIVGGLIEYADRSRTSGNVDCRGIVVRNHFEKGLGNITIKNMAEQTHYNPLE